MLIRLLKIILTVAAQNAPIKLLFKNDVIKRPKISHPKLLVLCLSPCQTTYEILTKSVLHNSFKIFCLHFQFSHSIKTIII